MRFHVNSFTILQMELLNDELLQNDEKSEEPKRNTKEALIDKILLIADENDLELSVSNTKLKRMNKDKLQKLLGELGEKVVKQQMADCVGANGSSDRAIGLATLRMVHDLLANATEQGLNVMLPEYGYKVNGFANSLKDPIVSSCVDDCLIEIAQTTDILEYVESPYARLAIAWSGAMMTCVRRCPKPVKGKNAKNLGPHQINKQNSFQLQSDRRPSTREINSSARPHTQNEK